jgi:hypothetical protein
LDEAVRLARRKSQTSQEFQRLVVVNCIEGRKEDEGYRFLADVGVSVQGQDSNAAWRAIHHVARELGCSATVVFHWRSKQEAAFPGVTGCFMI